MDLMAIRRGLMAQVQGGLPSAYQQVEWIKSDGNQYIDTGVLFNQGIKITAEMGWISKANTDTLFGARVNTGATRFLVTYYNGIDFAHGIDHIMPNTESINDGTLYSFLFDTTTSNKLYYGCSFNNTYDNPNYVVSNQNTDVTGYIFAYHRASDDSVQGKSKAIFKSLTIKNASGVKIFDGVPCYRKSDNEVGIYDLVGKTFLTNLGTGTFTKGNNV